MFLGVEVVVRNPNIPYLQRDELNYSGVVGVLHQRRYPLYPVEVLYVWEWIYLVLYQQLLLEMRITEEIFI